MVRMTLTTDMVIKKLNSKRYITIVPEIAVVNKTKIETVVEDTVFYEGRPVSSLNTELQRHIMSNIVEEDVNTKVVMQPSRLPPGRYTDDGLVDGTELKPTEVYITIAEIVDIYHEGYYIRFKDNDTIFNLTKDLSDAMNMLEVAVDVAKAKDIFNYINTFYITMTDNKEKVIKEKIYGKQESTMMVTRTQLIKKKQTINDITV